MLDNPPTLDSLGPYDALRRGHKRWEEMHSRIMQEPPTEGRDYIKHALNIFPFIEAISEAHPIAKAVISGFKAVLLLEQIREENEMRVAAVFLAGTDTMRVFLDISEVATSDGYRSTLYSLNYNSGLETVLRRIQVTVKDCGNSIDAYYRQSRMTKFYKAQDWKARMAGYVDDFKNHRVQLQEVLSLYTASNVKVLVTKMSDLVSRLFETKADWEKTLATQTENLGDRSGWLESEASLQALVSAAEDPVLGGIETKKVASKSHDVQSIKLSELRDELELSLDEFCHRNMNIFELKLAFHTQQLQDSIASSAQFVVRTLSGPHDRLQHEDLRELWKEMSWIFCVDNKLFSGALYEYYLDFFRASRISTLDSNSEANKERRNSSKADAWTLDYFANYGYKIALAIDRDNSGFVRISEANAFTDGIPNGWSLPQWCAYTVAGWSYECRIYRKRMHRLMFKLMEMQGEVLHNNRAYLLSIIEECHPIFAPLAWEPRGQQLPATTVELRSLVKEKVHAQDAALRAHLDTLQWNIEDESVLRLIYGDTHLEKYVLQLSTLVLEQSLILAEISCKLTLEEKEWDRLFGCQMTIRKVVLARVTSLSKNFAKTKDAMEDPKTYFGGIWSSVDLEKYRAYRKDYPIDYTSTDVADYHRDLSLLDDFPLPSVEGEPRKHLKYIPWEEYIKSMNEIDVPLAIPNEWDSAVIKHRRNTYRAYWAKFPFTDERWCDVCPDRHPIVQRYYVCSTCELRFDICASCYINKGPSAIEIKHHKMDHLVVKWTLNPRIGQLQWTSFEANGVLEDLRTEVQVRPKDQVQGDRAGDSDSDEDDSYDSYDYDSYSEEDEGGVIAAGADVAPELGLDIDKTSNEAGEMPPFPDDETMPNRNKDAEEMVTRKQPKDEDEAEEEGRDEEEEEEEKGENEAEGRIIAAGAAAAAELELDIDETGNEAGEIPTFPDDETMEIQNQDAEEMVTGNQAKDEEKEEEEEGAGNEEEENEEAGGVIAAGADVAAELGFDQVDGSKAGEVPLFPDDETMENQNQDAEKTETGNQAKDKDNSAGGGKQVVQVVQDPVAMPRSYTCGRCSKGIDLNSTFYRCVGHSCLDFFICQLCESIPNDSDAKNDDHHKWWHSLLVLRKSLIESVLEIASKKVEPTDTQVEIQAAAADSDLLSTNDAGPGTNPHSASISADTFHVALTAMEGKLDSTRVALEGQLNSTTMNLEERVVKLDEKLTELTKMLGDLIGRLNN